MMLVLQLFIILAGTKLAGDLSVKLKQPAVLGKLIIGIVLGPAVLGWIHDDILISELSEIGVLLLMFIAGLETDVEKLKQNWKSALAVALGGIALPFIGGYGLGISIGWEQNYSLFLGLLLSATSVSISVQSLKDLNQLSTSEGTTILGAAVIDDVLVVILMAFMLSLLGTEEVSLGLVIGKKALFFIGAVVIGLFVVPFLMRVLARLSVSEAIISAALIICFGFAYFAEWLGVAGIIGAFAAGIAISQTTFKKEVEHRIEPIAYAIFVPIFFVSIGLDVSFKGLGDQIGFIAGLSILAVVTKLVGAGLGARLTGFSWRSSIGIGSGMVSRGEVALIIAAIGLEAGLLPNEYFTSIVIVVILTTLVTPLMLKGVFEQKASKKKQL